MYDSLTRQRSAFRSDDLSTASPRRVLVKCFDRLDVDLAKGITAIEENRFEAANDLLGHAQDLLGEMAAIVDTDAWDHAGGLLSIYDYVLRLLAAGSMLKEKDPLVEARRLLAEIGDGFRTAAHELDKSAVEAVLEETSEPAESRPTQPIDGDLVAKRASFSALA
ncbi:MAG: flagellar export chaperone FliS [Ilumatobacter sp.]